MRYSGAMSTLPSFRSCLVLPFVLMALGACSTQVELRTAAQQEQWGREAAGQGDWAQAMRSYAAAAENAELGHGDAAWQARLHHEAGRAASATSTGKPAAWRSRSQALRFSRSTGVSFQMAVLLSTASLYRARMPGRSGWQASRN